MKANIKIEFDTFGELTSHLYELIRQVKKESKLQAKKDKMSYPNEAYNEAKPFRAEDNNCYGYHHIIVRKD